MQQEVQDQEQQQQQQQRYVLWIIPAVSVSACHHARLLSGSAVRSEKGNSSPKKRLDMEWRW